MFKRRSGGYNSAVMRRDVNYRFGEQVSKKRSIKLPNKKTLILFLLILAGGYGIYLLNLSLAWKMVLFFLSLILIFIFQQLKFLRVSNLVNSISILDQEKIGLTKRQKIIVVTVLITLGLVFSTQINNFIFLKYNLIIGLGVITYLLCLWALWEGMTKLKAIVLLILPTFFTISVASFYFLLPIRWLTRLPTAIIFSLSFYCLLLSSNVFNVASIRTIPLYRAASTAAFLFTLITAFFLFNVVYALRLPFYWNGVVVFLISLPLIMQILWSVEMERITMPILIYSLIVSMLVGEFGVVLSFWPVAPTIWSLTLSTVIYVLLGITVDFMRNRINQRIVWEHLLVGVVVFFAGFLLTFSSL